MSVDWDDFDRTLLGAGKRHAAPSNLKKKALAAAATAGVVSIGALAAKAPVVAAGKVATAAAVGQSVGLFSRLLALKWALLATTATVGVASVAVYAAHHPRAAEPTVSVSATTSAHVPSPPRATSGTRAPGTGAAEAPLAVDETLPVAPADLGTTASTTEAPPPARTNTVAADRAPTPARTNTVAADRAPTPAQEKLAPPASPPPRPDSANAAAAPSEAPSAAAHGLAAEIHLLDDARAALRRGEPARALVLCSEHATRFEGGSFVVERDVVRIDALVAAGRGEEARTRAAAFVAAHPGAPQAARLRKIAEGSSIP